MLDFKIGHNCWKLARAERGAVLVDAEVYFDNFVKAVRKAKKAVYILGWDFDTRLKLLRTEDGGITMAEFLRSMIKANPDLDIYILAWDFYSIFALERELLTKIKFGLLDSKRIHFYLDSDHPIAASHHQKVVVIDDQVAFSGGLDLCGTRWDTHEHLVEHPLRVNPSGEKYGPHHDVQIMLEGEPAKYLGDLARTRWQRFKQKRLEAPIVKKDNRFDNLDWEFGECKIAIARTEPGYKKRPEVREVERLYVEMINSAENYIFIENQYLSAKAVQKALISSLKKENGPEIVIVLPDKSNGWFAVQAMDLLRDEMISQLYMADQYNRLGVYYSVAADEEMCINIHSKVMIVDDYLLRVGSANTANRSMALDTECDIILDGRDQIEIRDYINWYYRWSIAHLMDVDVKDVPTTGMNNFIRGKQTGKHLEEFTEGQAIDYYFSLDEAELLDLESPIKLDKYMDEVGGVLIDKQKDLWSSGWIITGGMIGITVFLALLWRVTPLSEYINVESAQQWISYIETFAAAPFWILIAFVLAGFLMVPLNFLILAMATLFGSFEALLYIIVGSLLNSAITYGIGYLVGQRGVSKFFKVKFKNIAYKLQQDGLFSVLITRLIPIAPFAFVNMVAGAFHINFRMFMLGTLLGILPGTIILVFFQRSLVQVIKDPTLGSVSLFGGSLIIIFFAIFFLKRRLPSVK